MVKYKALIPIFLVFSLLVSCNLFRTGIEYQKGHAQFGNKLAVMGFQPALLPHQGPKTMRDPINGSVFMAEPTSEATAGELTDNLYRLLLDRGDYTLIPPGKVDRAAMDLEISRPGLVEKPKELYVEVGKRLGSDLIMVGYIYRWRERKGEAYGVKSAASVAFSLSLIAVKDGAVVWSGRFDKTQRSLTENLLDLITFLRGKGRWMSAKELALIGLEKVVKEIPSPGGLTE